MARTSTSSGEPLRDFCREVLKQEALLRQGGGKAGLERQRKVGRLPARERIPQLPDQPSQLFIWAIGPASFCRCRTRFFRTKTISAGSFEIIRSFPRREFRSSRRSW